ncbi:hypothetical protein LZ32DRAFT_604003 [Colletotrichum eremochloae]|nr:hypothetical protein LZ32DRAFT_604003 [Colletotrichum eremochloae]
MDKWLRMHLWENAMSLALGSIRAMFGIFLLPTVGTPQVGFPFLFLLLTYEVHL